MDLPQESTIDLDGRDFMRWFPTTGRYTGCPSWSKPLFLSHTLQPAGVSFSPKIGWLTINKTYQLRIHWPLLKILDIPPKTAGDLLIFLHRSLAPWLRAAGSTTSGARSFPSPRRTSSVKCPMIRSCRCRSAEFVGKGSIVFWYKEFRLRWVQNPQQMGYPLVI